MIFRAENDPFWRDREDRPQLTLINGPQSPTNPKGYSGKPTEIIAWTYRSRASGSEIGMCSRIQRADRVGRILMVFAIAARASWPRPAIAHDAASTRCGPLAPGARLTLSRATSTASLYRHPMNNAVARRAMIERLNGSFGDNRSARSKASKLSSMRLAHASTTPRIA